MKDLLRQLLATTPAMLHLSKVVREVHDQCLDLVVDLEVQDHHGLVEEVQEVLMDRQGSGMMDPEVSTADLHLQEQWDVVIVHHRRGCSRTTRNKVTNGNLVSHHSREVTNSNQVTSKGVTNSNKGVTEISEPDLILHRLHQLTVSNPLHPRLAAVI